MSAEKAVLLQIRGSGTPNVRTFTFSIFLDGAAILSDQALTPVESQEVREISGQYEMLFQGECEPNAAKDYIDILGTSLFHLWFGSTWSNIRAKLNGSVMKLVVSSDAPEVLSLPWELLRPDGEGFIGLHPGLRIIRLPGIGDLKAHNGKIPPGPLRVLFMACGRGQSLDYVAEEKGLMRAVSGLSLTLDSGDMGTFDELRERVDQFRPQVVHIAGQGSLKEGTSYFAFEGRSGIADLRPVGEIAQVLEDRGIQCLLITGCQTSVPSTALGLCHDLARSSVPMALCWPVSMADEAGESAARAFYSMLSEGIGAATSRAREAIGKALEAYGQLIAFPALYSSSAQDRIFSGEIEVHQPLENELLPLPGMTEGYVQDFVGRRRDLQKLLPALREGAVRTLIITGPPGAGKSSLLTRLARDLASEGFIPISIHSSENNLLSASRIMDACGRAFVEAALKTDRDDQAELLRSASQALSNPRLSPEDKLGRLMAALDNSKFVLVLDGFELNLGQEGKIRDIGVLGIYLSLLRHLTSSRAILTAERLPEDLMTLPSRAWEYSLGPLSEPDFNRFILRDLSLAAKYSTGDLRYEDVKAIYDSLGGYPLCLDRAASALRHSARLEIQKDGTCDSFTSRIYSSLPQISQAALSRAAVYDVPANQAALSAVVGKPGDGLQSMIDAWADLGLVHQIEGGLIAVSSHLRAWLVSRHSSDQVAVAQRDAGDFLRTLAEQRRSGDLGLSRLDCMLEARGHYLASGDIERARDATNRISGFLMGRGMYYDVRNLNEELLSREESPTTMSLIAQACAARGEYEEAKDWYQKCLDASSDDRNAANSLHGLASIGLHNGRYAASRENFKKALEIFRRLGDSAGEAISLHGIASIEMALGEDDPARQDLEKVLALQESLGDISGQASTLHDLIALDLRVPNYKAARAKLDRSVQMLRQIGDSSGEASALQNMASIDMEIGDLDVAREVFQRALAIRQLLNDRAGEASVLQSIALVDIQRGDDNAARDAFKRALEISQEIEDKPLEAASFFQLGIMASLQGKIKEGLGLIALSGIILRTAGSPDFEKVEPVVERLASQLNYSQDQFMQMIRQVTGAYRRDKGKNLLASAFGNGR